MKRFVWIVGCGLVALALVIWRFGSTADPPAGDHEAPARDAVTVRAVETTISDVQAWVFAEGTARAVRREYLTFKNPGRIA
jgi:multidrug efflux pump subunit AcrA (membrane-fusion protein)